MTIRIGGHFLQIVCFRYFCENQTPCYFSLRGMRAKVWKGRTESPLFNCQTYAHDLERLFNLMWERHSRNKRPDHITALSLEPVDVNGVLETVE